MKQLLSLFLFLLPCLALAQYPSNGNQKITLGEQTTADGLIWRGVLADTALITPRSDTSAYIILDTVNHRFYNYNRSTNVWSMAGVGSISSGLTGVLPVANGGTNTTTLTANKVMVGNGINGVLTPTNLHWNNTVSRLGIGVASPSYALDVVEDNEPYSLNSFAVASFTGSNTVANDISIIGPANSQVRLNFGRAGAGQSGEMGYSNFTKSFRLVSNSLFAVVFDSLQRVGINTSTPTARLHIQSGNSTIAPLRFTSGTLLDAPQAGAMEYLTTNLYFTPNTSVRHTVNHGLVFTATLNFASTNAQSSNDQTIAATGAALGDVVSLGVPNAAVNANTSYSAWVSAAGTVTVRFNNYSSGTIDPASGLFKVFVTK
jgi:hypothetical protein